MSRDELPIQKAVWVFVAFAAAYFLSTLLRAITATLSPSLSLEFGLEARDLGLLAGGYFLGFSLTQLPMGHWLDQQGPKKIVLSFLGAAVLGCLAFACATSFTALLLSRVLIGIGVSACLMAPLTGYRRWLAPEQQQRANAWMLMTGALGMLASTLPVQWLLPWMGWRWIFVCLAVLILLAMALIAWQVPCWQKTLPEGLGDAPKTSTDGLFASYKKVWAHPYFRSLAPIGFFNYGGMIAMQTLWAGPWLTQVSGYTPLAAATSLFWLNVGMLLTFYVWGLITPKLFKLGYNANQLMAYGVPLNFCVQLYMLLAGQEAATLSWILFCMTSSFVSLAQPAVGMAFPAATAGKALSAFNLVMFLGVFVVQWGMGLMIDGFKSAGFGEPRAFQCALGVFFVCCMVAYAYFLKHHSDSR